MYERYPNRLREIFQYISKRLDLTREESRWLEHSRLEYFPFDSKDPTQGFLEVVFPEGGRGVSGNGPILVFHFKRGECSQIGEMEGAWVEPDLTTRPTALNACYHSSANEYGEYRHELRNGQYVLTRHSKVVRPV